MILPPKVKTKTKFAQAKFRWPPDLMAELQALADRTDRSMNEAGELLMRWAIERAKAELDSVEQENSPLKRKKQ